MKRSLFLLALCGALHTTAQELTLDSAIARAVRNDRLQEQVGDLASTSALRQRDQHSNWYPQLTLSAQSTIQNEQMAFPIALPGLTPPEVPLDFHRALLNFNQTLYDGNVTRERRRLEAIDGDRQQLEAEAHATDLRGQVIQRYMGILVCVEQRRLLDTKANTLEEQRARVHNAVGAGAALASEEDALQAELITTGQDRIEVEATEQRLRNDLAILTGAEGDRNATLVRPSADAPAPADPAQRPDIRAFDLRLQALDAQLEVSTALRRPTVNVFGNAGVGNPGYNVFDERTRPMLLAGVGLQWRILDWGQLKRQRDMADLQRNTLRTERERMLRQVRMALNAQEEDVHKLDRLLEQDNALITLRGAVAQAKSEQLTLGTATASDYITELNKENAARLGLEIHQLQRLLAQRMQLNLAGQ